MTEVMAVPDAMRDSAGLMVWWELSGNVALEDLYEALEQSGFPESARPVPPSMEIALSRAVASALTSKRQLLRPLSRRGSWEVVLEQVASIELADGSKTERCSYSSRLRGSVERSGRGDGSPVPLLDGPDEDLKRQTLEKLPYYQKVLTPDDFSSWLLTRANALAAVTLRVRGGFYFVPRDRVEGWKRVVDVVRACSDHRMNEIPAMRTDEAIEAIITSVRAEALRSVEALEEYLKQDEVSTRGLNSAERQAAATREKLGHYCGLLGRSVPDLEARIEKLSGAIQASRIIAKEA